MFLSFAYFCPFASSSPNLSSPFPSNLPLCFSSLSLHNAISGAAEKAVYVFSCECLCLCLFVVCQLRNAVRFWGGGGAKVALSKSTVNIHQLLQRMLGQETWGLFPHLAPERGGPAECSSHHFLCCCSQLSNRVLILSVLASEPKVPCAAHIVGLFFFRLSSQS